MQKDFITAIKSRRSIYTISNKSTISDEKIYELIKNALSSTPSSFDMQSSRIVALLKDEHIKFWDIVINILKEIIPNDSLKTTEKKIKSFSDGYGTILFYEDFSVVNTYAEKFSKFKENFPIWANQSSAMLQFIIWNMLELEGLGASLQHYNPLIDKQVQKQWDISDDWKLIAQMPFGEPTALPMDKIASDIESKIKLYK